MIYVYNDEGVSPSSLTQTLTSFGKTSYSIQTLDAAKLIQADWTKDAALLIMPGGADLGYVKKLNGTGNQIIKAFVASGGAYLGLCAGGYYGAKQVEFDKGGPLEVLGSRELSFFKGKAIGPILAPYFYNSEKGARAAKLKLQSGNATVYYNGGGYFEHAESYSNVEIIARYDNGLPAIISLPYKQGRVVLSGVHFEYNPNLLDENDEYLKMIHQALIDGNAKRMTLFDTILKDLLSHQGGRRVLKSN